MLYKYENALLENLHNFGSSVIRAVAKVNQGVIPIQDIFTLKLYPYSADHSGMS